MHKAGSAHRDVKPHNVVVSDWSREHLCCKLVDLASACHSSQSE